MAFLESLEIGLARLGNCLLHLRDFFRALGKLAGSDRDKILGGDTEVLGRGEVGGLEDIKGEKGVNAVSHIVGGIAGGLADGNSFGPEDKREDFAPFRLLALASLHDRFADIEVLRLNNPVGSRVVTRDTDVANPAAFSCLRPYLRCYRNRRGCFSRNTDVRKRRINMILTRLFLFFLNAPLGCNQHQKIKIARDSLIDRSIVSRE